MPQFRPRPAMPPPADWLTGRLRPFNDYQIASVVPDGFQAYIRILHPACDSNENPLTWADVAGRSGRIMHSLAQFHAIASVDSSSMSRGPFGIYEPVRGNLDAPLLAALCEVLAQHTKASEPCFFGVWEGAGWVQSSQKSDLLFTPVGYSGDVAEPDTGAEYAVPEIVRSPKLDMPERSFYMLEGPLEAAADFGWMFPSGLFVPKSPNIFWPRDLAWCVASEIDLFCTLVAGSDALVSALLADPRLETWRLSPGDPITADSDHLNS